MLNFLVMVTCGILAAPCVMGCCFVIYKNVRFMNPPGIFSILILDLQTRSFLSLMAGGSFILLVTCGIEIPLHRTSSNYTLSGFYDTICRKNSSNISLPTEWFEEVHGELLGHNFRQLVQYCLVVFFYASQFAILEYIWLVKEREGASKLIALATYIIPSTVNKEERKKTIVQLMMHKVKKNESYFLSYMAVVSLYFILSICCVMTNPINPFGYQSFAVSSNDSEWTVDCNRRPLSTDDYILTQCRNNSTDYNFESICIVPTGIDTVYCTIIAWFFAILAILSALILIWSAGEVWYFGHHSMNGQLLLYMLRKKVGYGKHEEIIDAFEEELAVGRKEDGSTQIQTAEEPSNMEPETVILSAVIVVSPD